MWLLGYGLDDRGTLHDRGQSFKSGAGAHPASYPMGTVGSFPGEATGA